MSDSKFSIKKTIFLHFSYQYSILGFFSQAVRKPYFSRHNGDPIQSHPKSPLYHISMMFERFRRASYDWASLMLRSVSLSDSSTLGEFPLDQIEFHPPKLFIIEKKKD